ncbi:RtcB family protein [bacterium]|nr:RtcB family protein [bacterium]
MKIVNEKIRKVVAGNGREARIWVERPELVEEQALKQIESMLATPNLVEHIAVMPDVHWGMGATIGAVMALDDAIIPNCVGVDIGCGMACHPLGLKYEGELKTRDHWRRWLGQVQRSIPTGFNSHQPHPELLQAQKLEARAERGDQAGIENLRCTEYIATTKRFGNVAEMVLCQQGTMGGGNHFLEIQRDESDNLWLMVHSGSRHVGYQIAGHYAKLAQAVNQRLGQPAAPHLNWLSLSTPEGRAYLNDMQWAVDYALLNRKAMLRRALGVMGIAFSEDLLINIPHNYAAVEEHFGKQVVVHRKGATSARVDELGIIPGSMGTPSYIVRGLGNSESYQSCSHGAGRTMGRKAAKKALNTSMFAEALAGTFSTASGSYLDEAPQAYKAIDLVISAQDELVTVVHKLTPVITLKDGAGGVD